MSPGNPPVSTFSVPPCPFVGLFVWGLEWNLAPHAYTVITVPSPQPLYCSDSSQWIFGPLWIFLNALILVSVITSPKTLLVDKVTFTASGKWTSILGGHHSTNCYYSLHITSFKFFFLQKLMPVGNQVPGDESAFLLPIRAAPSLCNPLLQMSFPNPALSQCWLCFKGWWGSL